MIKSAVLATYRDTPLTQEEAKRIEEFWKPYSFIYKNNPETQRILSRISGKFSPAYIGNGLFAFGMWSFRNPVKEPYFATVNHIADHKIIDYWLMEKYAKMPRVYFVSTFGGVFLNEERELISKEDAVDICFELLKKEDERLIIKNAATGCGNSISFLESGVSKDEIAKVFNYHKEDFLCQQAIKNNSSYVTHPGALNTLRIVTMFYENDAQWVCSSFRMSTGKSVDNWAQGGIACGVNEKGICGDYAHDKSGKVHHIHPNGFQFAGHRLHNYEAAHAFALKLQRMMPFNRHCGWDITIDDSGEPVFIECNSIHDAAFSQSLGVPIYMNEEITKKILDEHLVPRFFYRKATFDWNYREYREHVSLAKYCGFDEIVKVPSEINRKKVKFMDDNAVSHDRITEVIIPASVKAGTNAVSGCAPYVKITVI